ncbi:MAG: hypothetical protein BMS9Abin37_1753 [Acidobacteriota bacterium]|nr:MAG: hypothetical protein BMS9Abin37_1753 [Acidobacteriota bacterium]
MCLTETINEDTGNLERINGVGRSLLGSGEPCRQCSSVVRRVWFTLLYVPIMPRSQYRVIPVSRCEFLSRKLR